MAMMDVLAEASFAASQQETEAVSILQGLFAARESPEPEDVAGTESADEADGEEPPRAWTREEDELLRRLALSKAGPQPSGRRGVAKPPVPALDMRAWREIATHFEDRTAIQCASRFRKNLSPDNVKGALAVIRCALPNPADAFRHARLPPPLGVQREGLALGEVSLSTSHSLLSLPAPSAVSAGACTPPSPLPAPCPALSPPPFFLTCHRFRILPAFAPRLCGASHLAGPWCPTEDAQLVELVQQYGGKHWARIASLLPGRTGKQCRERWCNNLDPSLKKGAWTAEEDQMILEMHAKLGTLG